MQNKPTVFNVVNCQVGPTLVQPVIKCVSTGYHMPVIDLNVIHSESTVVVVVNGNFEGWTGMADALKTLD